MSKKQNEIKSARALIMELTSLLEKDWKENQTSAFLTAYEREENNDYNGANPTEQDLLYILATAIYKANIANPSDFFLSMQLDIEKPKTYR